MSDYLLGHSPAELWRLTVQAEFLRPITKRMLLAAGLGTGMRVLDLGCGAGDVTMLAAELVGSEGHVVGLDRVASAVDFAAGRARQKGIRNVTFEHGTEVDQLDRTPFDFAVGRYVLTYQPNPPGLVRTVAAQVRRGGIVAFHEFDTRGGESLPPIPVFDRVFNEMIQTLGASASSPNVAIRLSSIFAEAGLNFPCGFCERPIGMEGSDLFFRWVAESYAAVRFQKEPDGKPVDVERLMADFEAGVAAVHGQAIADDQWCVWAKV
jgi:ubiquinone/menaquinone biosynthesis C-methylase UbiE